MKFKCIKDYWMNARFADDLPELAFKAGDVYTFHETGVPLHIVTHRDNVKATHYMDLDEEFFEYFIQEEE